GGLLSKVLMSWSRIPKKGIRFNLKKPQEIFVPGLYHEYYQLALMDLFGLARVEHPTRPVTPWVPAGIEHVPFGDAVFTLLLRVEFGPLENRGAPVADEDEEDQSPFGAWQPLFQPYFPGWRQNLEFPEPEERHGTFVFRISLGKGVWRRIAMPADDTLDDLA